MNLLFFFFFDCTKNIGSCTHGKYRRRLPRWYVYPASISRPRGYTSCVPKLLHWALLPGKSLDRVDFPSQVWGNENSNMLETTCVSRGNDDKNDFQTLSQTTAACRCMHPTMCVDTYIHMRGYIYPYIYLCLAGAYHPYSACLEISSCTSVCLE